MDRKVVEAQLILAKAKAGEVAARLEKNLAACDNAMEHASGRRAHWQTVYDNEVAKRGRHTDRADKKRAELTDQIGKLEKALEG